MCVFFLNGAASSSLWTKANIDSFVGCVRPSSIPGQRTCPQAEKEPYVCSHTVTSTNTFHECFVSRECVCCCVLPLLGGAALFLIWISGAVGVGVTWVDSRILAIGTKTLK